MSYSLNVAYIYIGEILCYLLLNTLPYFLLQNFFSYFPPLKPRCILWSEKYGSSLSHLKVKGAGCSSDTFLNPTIQFGGDSVVRHLWSQNPQLHYQLGDPEKWLDLPEENIFDFATA